MNIVKCLFGLHDLDPGTLVKGPTEYKGRCQHCRGEMRRLPHGKWRMVHRVRKS
jgi:hypothetical protein